MLTFKLWRDGSFEKLEMFKKGPEVRFIMKICPIRATGNRYILYPSAWTSSYWTAMSSFCFLTSGQHGGNTWDPNYTPGVDFLDHEF